MEFDTEDQVLFSLVTFYIGPHTPRAAPMGKKTKFYLGVGFGYHLSNIGNPLLAVWMVGFWGFRVVL